MKKIKRVAAIIMVAALTMSMTACSQDPEWVYKTDDYTMTAGHYLAYLYDSMNEALSTSGVGNVDAVFDTDIEGVKGDEWISNEAQKTAKQEMGARIEFSEQGLSLSDDDNAAIDSQLASEYTDYEDYMKDFGISKDSYRAYLEGKKINELLKDHYYGENGTEKTTDDQIKQYIADHGASYKYVSIPKTDSSTGDPYKGDQLDSLKSTVEGYLNEINNDGKSIDDINKEYQVANGTAEDQVTELTASFALDSDTTLDDQLKSSIFSAQAGGPAVMGENDDEFFIVQRFDANTQEIFDANRDQAKQQLEDDTYNSKLEQSCNDKGVKQNDSMLNKYNPKDFAKRMEDVANS